MTLTNSSTQLGTPSPSSSSSYLPQALARDSGEPKPAQPGQEEKAEKKRCGLDFLKGMTAFAMTSGLPLQQDDPLNLMGNHYLSCAGLNGTALRVEFDIPTYLSRVMVDAKPDAQEVLRKMSHFVHSALQPAELSIFQHGVGVCVPVSCTSLDEYVHATLWYVVCLATTPCKIRELELVGLPKLGPELNLTVIQGGDATSHIREEDEDEEEREKAQAVPEQLGGFKMPYWMGCGPQKNASSTWVRWSQLLKQGLGPLPSMVRNVTLAAEADRICEYHLIDAHEWLQWAAHMTEASCGEEHLHFEQEQPKPQYWQSLETWKHITGFCPHGYAAALLARAFTRSAAGLVESAAEDLRRARLVLGGCEDLARETYRQCSRTLWPSPCRRGDSAAAASARLDPRGGEAEDFRGQCVEEHERCEDRLLRHGVRLLQEAPLVAVAT